MIQIMLVIYEESASIKNIIVITAAQATALSDKTRMDMLKMLYHDEMTVSQIHDKLSESGREKTMTTTRHHAKILEGAGLIQVTKLKTVRGVVAKEYGTSFRLLNYESPENFDKEYSRLVDNTATKVDKLLRGLISKIPRPKDAGHDEEYYQYLALEILNRAATKSLEPEEKTVQ